LGKMEESWNRCVKLDRKTKGARCAEMVRNKR